MNSYNQFHAIKIIRYVVVFVFKNKFILNLTKCYFNTKKNQRPTTGNFNLIANNKPMHATV